MNNEFLKAYSIKEASKEIDVAEGTIRQWEKDFNLDIPRDKNNARYFTTIEIESLTHIKAMRDKNLSKAVIKELLDKRESQSNDVVPALSVPVLRQTEVTEALMSIKNSFENFPELKKALVDELKDEIKESIHEELAHNFKKQNEFIANELKKVTDSQKQLEEVKKEQGFFARLFKK